MKKLLALFLIFAMLLPVFITGCSDIQEDGPTKTDAKKYASYEPILGHLKGFADDAYTNAVNNYWEESNGLKQFHNRYKEDRTSTSDLIWHFIMMMLAMETYAEATGDYTDLKYYVENQMNTWYTKRDKDWLLGTGKNTNSPAHDDAAWSCMGFMLAYKITGDEKALEYCHELLGKAYDYWQDGDTGNGLWYSYTKDVSHETVKSLYCVGFILSGLEYHNLTKGTEKEDIELYNRTMALYNWVEEKLRRDVPKEWMGKTYNFVDNLYFNGFSDSPALKVHRPSRLNYDTTKIAQGASWTCLFGNMGMSVVNKRLYDMTGDKKYRDKAVATANALVNTAYNNNGTIVNDADAWTNSAFMGYFVREVLPLPGVDRELGRMFMNTAISIMKNTYYEGGFYGADWDGSGAWLKNDYDNKHTQWIATNATTIHVLFSAYYLMKNEYIAITDNDLNLFDEAFTPCLLSENGKPIKDAG